MKKFLLITGSICLAVILMAACAKQQTDKAGGGLQMGETTSPTAQSTPAEIQSAEDNTELDFGDFTEAAQTQDQPADTTAAGNRPEQPDTQPQSTQPEPSAPQTTAPVETQPETTVSQTTQPQSTQPEPAVPQTTEPEETQLQTTVPETTVPETTVPVIEEDGYFSQIIRP